MGRIKWVEVFVEDVFIAITIEGEIDFVVYL